jgi:hypothetical protein
MTFGSELKRALLKNEWIHVEFKLDIELQYQGCESPRDDCDEMQKSLQAEFGIHVLKEENNLENIKFTKPYIERENQMNISAPWF